jgi:hypothetical protein
MDAVTYPDPGVIGFLQANFRVVKLDIGERAKDGAAFVRPGVIIWTPLLVYSDHRGRVVRQQRGYLEPADFIAEGELALALAALLARNLDESVALLEKLAQAPTGRAEIAAEALYWGGVAAYRITGDKAALVPIYRELVERFPKSLWAGRAWPYLDWEYGRAKLGI